MKVSAIYQRGEYQGIRVEPHPDHEGESRIIIKRRGQGPIEGRVKLGAGPYEWTYDPEVEA